MSLCYPTQHNKAKHEPNTHTHTHTHSRASWSPKTQRMKFSLFRLSRPSTNLNESDLVRSLISYGFIQRPLTHPAKQGNRSEDE